MPCCANNTTAHVRDISFYYYPSVRSLALSTLPFHSPLRILQLFLPPLTPLLFAARGRSLASVLPLRVQPFFLLPPALLLFLLSSLSFCSATARVSRYAVPFASPPLFGRREKERERGKEVPSFCNRDRVRFKSRSLRENLERMFIPLSNRRRSSRRFGEGMRKTEEEGEGIFYPSNPFPPTAVRSHRDQYITRTRLCSKWQRVTRKGPPASNRIIRETIHNRAGKLACLCTYLAS